MTFVCESFLLFPACQYRGYERFTLKQPASLSRVPSWRESLLNGEIVACMDVWGVGVLLLLFLVGVMAGGGSVG